MTTFIPFGRAARHNMLFAGLLASAACMASAAFAGDCPADKIKADARQPVSLPADTN
jgi:F0F1-type ATP synthase membrane subunit c/vacuolar-type H+-ATPase subunit K